MSPRIMKRTYEIGTIIKDEFRNIELTDFVRQPGRYGYKYKCNKCGYDGSQVYCHNKLTDLIITEKQLEEHKGCSVCGGRVVSPQINSIAIEHPNLIKYFVNKEEAYKYRTNSNVRTQFICPTCGKIYKKEIYSLFKNGLRCENCSDKKSMGERIMRAILNSINENYIMEYTHKHATLVYEL